MRRTDICDAYLQALELGHLRPSLECLTDISQRHVARFAFSSVGPRLGDALPLDVASLHDRIVVRARGGYCFEQNGLLFEMLEELGFDVTLYLARVIYNQDGHPGLTHRVTVVDFEGARYLVDVGFGPLGPRGPVSMLGVEAKQAHGIYRVAEMADGECHLQTMKDGEPFSLYRFELSRYGQADCEVGHFYSHRHENATFVNHLVVSRILESEIRSLRNREYRIITAAGEQARGIHDAAELRTLLEREFDLLVTAEESQRLFAAPA